MAIRLRWINNRWIAICAARSVPKEGDLYIDDGQHHALGSKFARDGHEMYGIKMPYWNEDVDLVEQEESNNPNRDWWDRTYGDRSSGFGPDK